MHIRLFHFWGLKRSLLGLLMLSFVSSWSIAKSPEGETQQAFIERMVETHQMDKSQLEKLFNKAKREQKIIDLMNRPAESLPWHKYRNIFISDKRIQAGVDFWNKYEVELKRAEATFQVPASMIVGILGIETYYGKNQGKIPVWDALYTLGFHYPKRGRFFRGEMEQFLLLCQEQGWDILEPVGSYAGAMGMGQFISTSYREYAVDFDGDGRVNLFSNPVDAIGSVANYFRRHKWRWGEPVAYKVTQTGESHEAFAPQKMKPQATAGALKAAGFQWPIETLDEQQAAIFPFEQSDGDDHWVIFDNFYVITRYNRSPLYALAVYQFSQKVVAERAKHYWHG